MVAALLEMEPAASAEDVAARLGYPLCPAHTALIAVRAPARERVSDARTVGSRPLCSDPGFAEAPQPTADKSWTGHEDHDLGLEY